MRNKKQTKNLCVTHKNHKFYVEVVYIPAIQHKAKQNKRIQFKCAKNPNYNLQKREFKWPIHTKMFINIMIYSIFLLDFSGTRYMDKFL